MQIQRSGRASKEIVDGMEAKLGKTSVQDYNTPADKKLGDDRKDTGHKHDEGTLELLLDEDRSSEADGTELHEKMLSKDRTDGKRATTESLLNSSSGNYPHRNEDAWKRTKDKRPVNALNEEMGESGDKGKLERYERASKPGKKRVVDKDVGVQRSAYNHKKQVTARQQAAVAEYLAYKNNRNPWSPRLIEARKIDSQMASIMSASSGRSLTDEEKSRLDILKAKKSEVLRVAPR